MLLLACLGTPAVQASTPETAPAKAGQPQQLDRSGKIRIGKASYYGREFYGKKMANGERMKPRGDNAASKTLPLGTKAAVTNLENGKTDVVVIKDRGPYVAGRIIDVSPQTAIDLDFKEQGITPVLVMPLEIPKRHMDSARPD
ncbi:MAG: septal ring lytic transglycosylase RlpA family protein [Pseudomonadota bacterium]